MKILILTGRFGMGHIKCAEAIRDTIFEKTTNVSIVTIDIMDYILGKASDIIYKSFKELVTNLPELYNKLNEIVGKNNTAVQNYIPSMIIKKMIDEEKPDLIISNLPISTQFVGSYKKKYKSKIPLFQYVTDITFHKEWVNEKVDRYFVGDSATKTALVNHGVDGNIITICGIPVSNCLYPDKSQKKSILVMGGGFGLVPGGESLLDALDRLTDTDVTLVCGNNRQLFEKAKNQYRNITVLGKIDYVPRLMNASHLLISKPGGITTFEAIKSKTPLVIFEPELEQETGNANFIMSHSLGIMLKKNEISKENLEKIINDTEEMTKITENMTKLEEEFSSANPLQYL